MVAPLQVVISLAQCDLISRVNQIGDQSVLGVEQDECEHSVARASSAAQRGIPPPICGTVCQPPTNAHTMRI